MAKDWNESDLVVQLQDVRKVYRLYRKPVFRVLDLLGMCSPGSNHYTEHAALDGLSLQIRRGEKVAIIGRNGAGKSTLLKIITRTIQPTSGQMDLYGKVSALLQIGTGFHGDFTGRQNAYAAMALQGITGKLAHEKFDEILDFAELEEYIDQPMKTYSTGMCARLMFSSSIVITPDILVVDEVLGVGDAYFTHKSFDRMRQLCTEGGTTLLLVTHDIFSALNLCDRFVWIDHGQVKMDGAPKPTMDAYDQSIKEQEEDRLRKTSKAAVAVRRKGKPHWFVKVATRSGFAVPKPCALERIELAWADGMKSTLTVASSAAEWTLLAEGNLGPVESREGRACRSLAEYGSIYHKAEWVVASPRDEEPSSVAVRFLYEGQETVRITVSGEEGTPVLAGDFDPGPAWQEMIFSADTMAAEANPLRGLNRKGNGRILIESVEFLADSGEPATKLVCGQSANLRIRLKIRDPSVPRRFAYSFGMRATHTSALVGSYSDQISFPGEADEAYLTFRLDPLLIGSGRYFLSCSIYEPDIYEGDTLQYITINPKLYCSVLRPIEFVVESHHQMDSVMLVKHPVSVAITGIDAESESATQAVEAGLPASERSA